MDHNRQELLDIHAQLNHLIHRLKEANWTEDLKKPALNRMAEASVEIYRIRLEVGVGTGT